MKKIQLFSLLLAVSVSCAFNSNVAAATAKSANKPVVSSHKKARYTKRHRRMTEKDVAECTQLINKVAETDHMIHNEMAASIARNNVTSGSIKKSANGQLFASDDPVAIAHLTGKSAQMPTLPNKPFSIANPEFKKTVQTAKLAPAPVLKPTTATLVTPSTKQLSKIPPKSQVFASDNPQAVAHLTGKITTPIMNSGYSILDYPLNNPSTRSITKTTVSRRSSIKPSKPLLSKQAMLTKTTSATKSTSGKKLGSGKTIAPRPRIQLFAPNQPNLNKLKGKSADLTDIEKAKTNKNPSTAPKKASTDTKKNPS